MFSRKITLIVGIGLFQLGAFAALAFQNGDTRTLSKREIKMVVVTEADGSLKLMNSGMSARSEATRSVTYSSVTDQFHGDRWVHQTTESGKREVSRMILERSPSGSWKIYDSDLNLEAAVQASEQFTGNQLVALNISVQELNRVYRDVFAKLSNLGLDDDRPAAVYNTSIRFTSDAVCSVDKAGNLVTCAFNLEAMVTKK